MMNRLSVCFFAIALFAACNKKDPATKKVAEPMKKKRVIVTEKPVRAGETDFMLPAGTTLTFAEDGYSIDAQLPADFTFIDPVTNSVQPIGFATYRCNCSAAGTACKVFYEDNNGFGCLHSSCSGSCSGTFTYKGYELNRVLSLSKFDFLSDSLVQQKIATQFALVLNRTASRKDERVYVKQQLYGVNFYFLTDSGQLSADALHEVIPYGKAVCDCEGTKACTLKTIGIALDGMLNKIFYCDGPCSCELTVNG